MKTDERFKTEVRELVGEEYLFLEEYRGSHEKLKVLHEKCGYVYKVSPSNFTHVKTRCPKCSSEKRKTTTEEFKNKLSRIVGSEFELIGEYVNSNTKVTLEHKVCGEEFKVSPASFLHRLGKCPECPKVERRSKIRKLAEELVNGRTIKEFARDYSLSEQTVSKWRTEDVYLERLSELTKEVDVGEFLPRVFRKWDTKSFKEFVMKECGNDYSVMTEYETGHTPIVMVHNICGKEFYPTPKNFMDGSRCPACRRSKGEEKVAETLDSLGIQYIEEWRIGERGPKALRFDFYIPEYRACIEYDGAQHFRVMEHWGGTKDFQRVTSRDMVKNHYCHYKSIELLRIPEWKYADIENIVRDFVSRLEGRSEWQV